MCFTPFSGESGADWKVTMGDGERLLMEVRRPCVEDLVRVA
jgi:hypothetical protein